MPEEALDSLVECSAQELKRLLEVYSELADTWSEEFFIRLEILDFTLTKEVLGSLSLELGNNSLTRFGHLPLPDLTAIDGVGLGELLLSRNIQVCLSKTSAGLRTTVSSDVSENTEIYGATSRQSPLALQVTTKDVHSVLNT